MNNVNHILICITLLLFAKYSFENEKLLLKK